MTKSPLTFLLPLLALALPACDSNKKTLPPLTRTTAPAAAEDGAAVYFSTRANCTEVVAGLIRDARTSVKVQAYSFKSDKIAEALVAAKKRGLDVRVIIDADKTDKKNEGGYLHRQGVKTYVDSAHDKAHNKVVLIDGRTIVTGSFNFTDESGESAADNLVTITDKPKLMAAYDQEFDLHLNHSTPYKDK